MIHAWVHDDNPLGVFSMLNSNIPPLIPEGTTMRQSRDASHKGTDAKSRSAIIENFQHSTIELEAGESRVG